MTKDLGGITYRMIVFAPRKATQLLTRLVFPHPFGNAGRVFRLDDDLG